MRNIQSETHVYIAAHAGELAKLAEDAKLPSLAYILRMAELEAKSIGAALASKAA